MKIDNDKYYTPIETANKCIDKCIELIGIDKITDIIEPSVGNGSFLHHDRLVPNFACDILPEVKPTDKTQVVQQDYLTLNAQYKKGRLVIGNPPFGAKLNLAQKFFKKSVLIADYIAFVLPISQYNNTQSLYEFDLVYSQDLGEQIYSGVKLHCCFNIYKRPQSGFINKKPSIKQSFIKITREDSKNYDDVPYDIRICYWGDGSIGKILTDTDKKYSGEYKIQIIDKGHYKQIYDFITTFDWKGYVKSIAMSRLKQFHIINALCENLNLETKKDKELTLF